MNSEHRIIDIHAHILPGVDDGARDMDESLAMAKMAYAEGVRAIIATPHRRPEETKDRSDEINERTAGLIGKIREWQQENDLKEPLSLYTGQENAWNEELPEQLLDGKALTLAGSRYVLVEFAGAAPYDVIFAAVRHLTDAGYIPVIAHMERCRNLYLPRNLQEIISAGAMLSMNYDTIAGPVFSPYVHAARNYVREGAVAVLTSDMHQKDWRPPAYRKAMNWLINHLPEEQVTELTYSFPKTILKGKDPG